MRKQNLQRILLRIILCCLISVFHFNVEAKEPQHFRQSIRALGMGNAFEEQISPPCYRDVNTLSAEEIGTLATGISNINTDFSVSYAAKTVEIKLDCEEMRTPLVYTAQRALLPISLFTMRQTPKK